MTCASKGGLLFAIHGLRRVNETGVFEFPLRNHKVKKIPNSVTHETRMRQLRTMSLRVKWISASCDALDSVQGLPTMNAKTKSQFLRFCESAEKPRATIKRESLNFQKKCGL